MMLKVYVTLLLAAYTIAEQAPGYHQFHNLAQPLSYINHAPAPVYENLPLPSSQESRHRSLDGTEQTVFSKSIISPYSTVKKYDSRNSNGITQSVPTIHAIHPVNYVQDHQNLSPYIQTPSQNILAHSFSSNLVAPAVSVNENQAVKSTVTYSDAPSVSHMTFTGLGASYSW